MNNITLRRNNLKAEVLGPGLYRFQKISPKNDVQEVIVANLNTDSVLWQDVSQSLDGKQEPFHIYHMTQLENAQPDSPESRAGSLLKQGRDFLKTYHVTFAPDSQASEKVQALTKELAQRLSRDPMSVSTGDCVALITGEKENNKIYLMKVLGTDNWEHGRVVSYHGVVIQPLKEGFEYQYVPTAGDDKTTRYLWKNDYIVPITPEELRELFLLQFHTEKEELLKQIGQYLPGNKGNAVPFTFDKKKGITIFGDVAV